MPSLFDASREWWASPEDGEDEYADFPEVPKGLVAALKERIPPPRPRPGSTEREDLFQSGAWGVVELLEEIFDHQNEVSRVHRKS